MWGRLADLAISPLEVPDDIAGLAELFRGLRHLPYAMLLLSGGNLDCSRYCLMGWDPYLVIRGKGGTVEVRSGGQVQTLAADPFDVLDEALEALKLPGPPPLAPCAAGAMGFLAYDLKNRLERLPATAKDDLGLPELVWAFPRRLVVQDRWEGRFWSVRVHHEGQGGFSQPAGPEVADLIRAARVLEGERA